MGAAQSHSPEVRLASVSAFCPFFFRQFNCCANICPAAIDPARGEHNYVQGKVHLDFIFPISLPPPTPPALTHADRGTRYQRLNFCWLPRKRNCVERDAVQNPPKRIRVTPARAFVALLPSKDISGPFSCAADLPTARIKAPVFFEKMESSLR